MIVTYTNSTINQSKDIFAVYDGTSTWYAFPKAITEATLEDYKLWSEDSGRSIAGESKGSIVGIFPKLQIKIGKQSAGDRAVLCSLLNKTAVKVRAYSIDRQRFEEASFYFGDVSNKIKHWDKHGTLGTRNATTGVQTYTCNAVFDGIQFSIISNKRRVTYNGNL